MKNSIKTTWINLFKQKSSNIAHFSQRIKNLITVLALIMTMENVQGQIYSGGIGTSTDPYKISTAEDLVQMSANAQGPNSSKVFYELTQDIDLSTVCNTIAGSWQPIGNSNSFRGTFIGNNHSISNLYINSPETNYQGLFGIIDSASISGLNLVNSNIKGNDTIGSICGHAKVSTISNCTNSGYINGNSIIGGICGIISKTNINSCTNSGNVNGNNNIGGICGNIDTSSTVNYVSNSSNVYGTNYIGGICGSTLKASINNSFNNGNVNGNSCVGGVCGYNNNNTSTISSCYYDKQMCNIAFGNGATTNDGLGGNNTGSEGKLTTEMIGTLLKANNEGEGWTNDNFTFTNNMYPRPKSIENIDVTIVSSTPAFLFFFDPDTYESVDSVSTNFTINTENNVIWANSQNKTSINGNTVTLKNLGKDTLTITLGNS